MTETSDACRWHVCIIALHLHGETLRALQKGWKPFAVADGRMYLRAYGPENMFHTLQYVPPYPDETLSYTPTPAAPPLPVHIVGVDSDGGVELSDDDHV